MHPVVDPDLYPDLAHLGLGLLEAVIYVGVERVQGNPSLGDGLGAAHLDAAKPPSALDPGALGPTSNGTRKGPLHGPPKRGAPDELLGDRLGDEAGVQLRPRHFPHVDLYLLLCEPLELTPQLVYLAAALADHDARTGGVDVNGDLTLLGGLPDLDVGYACPGELLLDVLANLEVLAE